MVASYFDDQRRQTPTILTSTITMFRALARARSDAAEGAFLGVGLDWRSHNSLEY